ncbi:hypothetical protein L208DRAFT_1379894 [Tricholoma matsutake]|nr:hypothetical protein L208DRAFT_1379894 [Tricholoma matsutake 945]
MEMKENKIALGFEDVFGNPAQEQVCRAIKGPQACNLEKATYMLAEKFKWGGPGSKLAHTYQLHYISLIQCDIEQWGSRKGNLIAPLPMVYSLTPTNPATAPIIQVGGNTGPTSCLTPQSDYSMPQDLQANNTQCWGASSMLPDW